MPAVKISIHNHQKTNIIVLIDGQSAKDPSADSIGLLHGNIHFIGGNEMKKLSKILALLLALTMLVSLAACGSSGDTTTSNPPSSNSEPAQGNDDNQGGGEPSADTVTLNWAIWDKDSTPYWTALAEGYMASHDNVKIEMTDLGSTDYMTQLATQLSGGNGELDVLSIKDIPGYANLINLEMLEPLNDVLTTPAADFGGVLDQLTAENGNFYGIPFRSDLWVVFYNKDLFDAVGVDYPSNDMTLAEFDALARQMTSGTGADKVYGNHYHTWRSDVSLFGVLDGKNTIVDGTYDFLKPIYEMVLAQQNDGIVMDYGELKTAGLHYSAAFENGSAAMVNMGSWFLGTLLAYNDSAASEGYEPVNFGMVKYPHPDGVPAGTTLGTVTSLGVNANSANKEAAIDFCNWCASAEGAAVMASTGNFPAIFDATTLDMIASLDGFPTDEASKEALNTVAIYLEMPLSDKASEIETVLNTEHDAIMTGAETIDEGIANMNEQVQAILNG